MVFWQNIRTKHRFILSDQKEVGLNLAKAFNKLYFFVSFKADN